MGKPHEEIDEAAWTRQQRAQVDEYLRKQRVRHGGIGDHPAFSVPPYLSLWAIQSNRTPGAVGWWAISGDLPTDYISSSDGRTPREAIRAFSRVWREASACMLRGEKMPHSSIGTPEQWPELGKLLETRASILASYAADDDLWEE